MSENSCEIYWPNLYNLLTSKNSLRKCKQLKKIFLYMSARNSLQYKQFLCVLIPSKCNAEFIDQICIIYRLKVNKLKKELIVAKSFRKFKKPKTPSNMTTSQFFYYVCRMHKLQTIKTTKNLVLHMSIERLHNWYFLYFNLYSVSTNCVICVIS